MMDTLTGKPELPDWIKEIQKMEIENINSKDVYNLLQAYIKLRVAVEQAPHDEGCAAVQSTGFGYTFTRPELCTCWKSEALAFKPEV